MGFRTRRSNNEIKKIRRKREAETAREYVNARLRKNGREQKVQRRSESVAMIVAEARVRNKIGIREIANGIIGNVIGITGNVIGKEEIVIGIEGK